MALRRWQPHRMTALVVVILLWQMVLICLPRTSAALAQPAGCSISSPDVSLNANCALGDAGNLTGTFTVPAPPTSSQTQTPSPCPGSGPRGCTSQITVKACADASSTLCASASFTIETNIIGAPASASPALAGMIAETGICSAACRSDRTAGRYEPAITVELTVDNPVITLSPSLGEQGTSVRVTGSGFALAPATSPATTSPATASPPPASSLPPPPTPRPVPVPSNFLLAFFVAVGVTVVLAAVILLLQRRPPHGDHGSQGSTTAHVHARVSGATPRPVMRNRAGQQAAIVRIEVHRQAVELRIEKRTHR
jgi:hypothetical protein